MRQAPEDMKGSGKMISDSEKRLAAFEKMLRSVKEQYDSADERMKKLKTEGREKTATYRQLMGNKMQLQNIISIYKVYDLID